MWTDTKVLLGSLQAHGLSSWNHLVTIGYRMECSDWTDPSLTAPLPHLQSGCLRMMTVTRGRRSLPAGCGRSLSQGRPGVSPADRVTVDTAESCTVTWSSLRHLDSVRSSSRGSASSASSRTKLTLLERFLQDVLQHHPHRYNDPRPSHADLPSVSTPPLPRAELDELCFSDDDSRSLCTREHLPSSDDASLQPVNQLEDVGTRSQSGERASQERVSAPIRDQKERETVPHTQTPPSKYQTPPPESQPTPYQAPPSVHRKAHRKTNRRKTSDSSSSTQPPRGPGPAKPTELRPWRSWQKERREAHKEEVFSSDQTDPLDRTINEVIQMCCHGISSPPCQKEETESFHLSLPGSMETQSEAWDSPVQVLSQRGQTLRETPVQVSQTGGQDLSRLMDAQVDLEDQVYSYQLDSALHSERRPDQGFWTLPIEEVLPAPERIPESFRGKTWAQIEEEDEVKVERLVQQFRRGRFICYFDSESLARYGRRSQNKKGVDPDTGALPLLDQDDNDSSHLKRRRRGGGRRGFRLASRCQVVKVSHGTQTVRLVVPAVHQLSSEAPPTSDPAANKDAVERTPEAQTWRCLPPSYSDIVTPVQPRTSLVYLLCSPSGPTPTCTPAAGSLPKRCRKKRRPLDLQGLRVKYKRLPVRFYEPGTNRILKNPPKGFVWRRGPAPSGPLPPCVRQLFRSLSPDLNADRLAGEGDAGSSRVKGHRSSDFCHSGSFLLSTLSRDSGQTALVRRRSRTCQAPPPGFNSSSERARGGRRERPRSTPATRRTRAQATPPQPRREGLRRAGPGRKLHGSTGPAPLPPTPSSPSSARRGRGRRGRGCERGRR
ncbi:DBF4-type zinc finger-containing protein 2 isoform X2 [Brachyistius frenatus]